MIRTATEMVRDMKSNMRGGHGDIEIMHIFTQEEMGSTTRLFAKITMPQGSSIGFHDHNDEEEVYYITKGRGLVNDAGEQREIGVGDGVLTGGGAGHSIENIGDEPLEMIAVVILF